MKKISSVSIIGMGALGLLYGDHIARALGQEAVTYCMDPARAEKYKDTVYTVNEREVPLRRISCTEAAPADLVIVAVKYTGLKEAFSVMAPCIGPDTIILSVLNGISSEDMIAEHFGRKHMIYTVPQGMDAMKFGPALRFTQMGNLHMGITDPAAKEDLDSVCAFFDEIRMPYILEEDILWRMWFKYMLNVGVNQVCMVYSTSYAGVIHPGEPHDTLMGAMREVMYIAQAKGIGLDEGDMQTCLDIEATLDPEGIPSMAQDRVNKKASEVEMFAGTVIKMGQELGIPTPVNEWIYQRVHEIESEYVMQGSKGH